MWFRLCGNGSNDEGRLNRRGASAFHQITPCHVRCDRLRRSTGPHRTALRRQHERLGKAQLAEKHPDLLKEERDLVSVYGEIYSTIVGSLAAAKLHIPYSG